MPHSGNGPAAAADFSIPALGERRYASPMIEGAPSGRVETVFFSDARRVLYDTDWHEIRRYVERGEAPPALELAGPRRRLYWKPKKVRAAIVTAGGLCPGINNVVRALVLTLFWHYGVEDVVGLRYGLRGFEAPDPPPLRLTPDVVRTIHGEGGSLLGSSRGTPPIARIIDFLVREKIQLLFLIGGDGTQRAVLGISEAARAQGHRLSVIGVPKTIDNDIPYVDRSFGFTTAVGLAREVIDAAHAEAQGAFNGVGLVRLMGRDAGFITANAALASGEANFVLVPEVPFDIEGPNGLLAHLGRRLESRHHALIVVAEGAGQRFLAAEREKLGCDPSGNPRLGDIGRYLAGRIRGHFTERGIPVTLRYIDPGYIIRSALAGAFDAIYCQRLGHNAVHAAMAGKTEMIVGRVHGRLVHVPSRLVAAERRRISTDRPLWRAVLQSTGQPERMVNR